MTDMFYDGRYPVTLASKEYHFLFSLKLLSELQCKMAGTESKRLADFLGGNGSYDNFCWLLTRLINEGAAPGEEPIAEDTVSKLAHPGTHAMLYEAIMKSFLGKNPNEPLVDPEDEDEEEEYEDEIDPEDGDEDEKTEDGAVKNLKGGKNG